MTTRPALLLPFGCQISDLVPSGDDANSLTLQPPPSGILTGGDGLAPALNDLLPPSLAGALLARREAARNDFTNLNPIDLDDAMRRIRPANTLRMGWTETWTETLAEHFASVLPTRLVTPDFDRWDASSLRIVVHAWLRAAWRRNGRPLHLHLLPSGDGLSARSQWQLDRMSSCFGLDKGNFPDISWGDHPTKSGAGDAVTAFLERDYHAVEPLLDGRDDLEARQLRALVLARTGTIQQSAHAWRKIAADDSLSAWNRASACSSEAVCQAKEMTQASNKEAFRAIRRGRALLEGLHEPEAAHIRGWLWNNEGLLAALKYARTRTTAALDHAERCLAHAFDEASTTPEQAFPNLHHNLVANAVQIYEMRGKYAGAVRTLDDRFGDGLNSVYLYRRSALLARAGADDEAMVDFARAAEACPPHAWFFREVIEHARGSVLLDQGNAAAAADHFRTGLRQCEAVGMRSGIIRQGLGLRAACPRDPLLKPWMNILPVEGATRPRPLPKLPPFVAELDLCPPPNASVNFTLNTKEPAKHPVNA